MKVYRKGKYLVISQPYGTDRVCNVSGERVEESVAPQFYYPDEDKVGLAILGFLSGNLLGLIGAIIGIVSLFRSRGSNKPEPLLLYFHSGRVLGKAKNRKRRAIEMMVFAFLVGVIPFLLDAKNWPIWLIGGTFLLCLGTMLFVTGRSTPRLVKSRKGLSYIAPIHKNILANLPDLPKGM